VGDPTRISLRESTYHGMKYHFCSDGCKDIFDDEPEKYVQAWLPVHQIYQGNCFLEGADPTAPGFNPLAEVLKYYHMTPGADSGDFNTSPDRRNWERWTGEDLTPPAAQAA
jgi:phenol hydroxylase P3 protein